MAFLSRKTIQRRKKMRVAQRPGRFLQRRVSAHRVSQRAPGRAARGDRAVRLSPGGFNVAFNTATAVPRNVYFVAFHSSAAASAFLISVDVPL
jgi:hypothetical protein